LLLASYNYLFYGLHYKLDLQTKKIFRIAVIIAILISLVFFISNINLGKLFLVLSNADPLFVGLIIISYFLAILMFILAWHVILSIVTTVKFKHNFIATLLQIFGNIVIPSASLGGEILRVNYLKNRTNTNLEKLIASIAINRLQYGITMIAFIMIGLFFILLNGIFSLYIFLAFIIIIISTFIIYFLTFKSKVIKSFSAKIINFSHKKFNRPKNYLEAIDKVNDFIDKFDHWIKNITNNRLWFLGIFLMILQWLFSSLTIYLAFLAIHYKVNFTIIVFTYPIFVLLTVTPLGIPGNIGFLDLVMIGLYTKLGIDIVYATAATLIARSFMLLEDLLISVPFAIKHRKHYIN